MGINYIYHHIVLSLLSFYSYEILNIFSSDRDFILLWETAMKEYLLEQIQERPDLFIAFSTDRALAVSPIFVHLLFLDPIKNRIFI